MSAVEQITTLLETLSFAEKLSLNERIATAIRKEGGGAKTKGGKTAKKSKGSDAEDQEAKPKRKAAAGTLAWTAFVKHVKETQPDIFEGVKKESEKLTLVKGIRAEDMDAYKTFVEEWKEKYAATSSAASEAEEEEAEPAPAPPAPKTAAEKLAALKAAAAEKKAAAAAPVEKKAASAKPVEKKAVKTVKAAPAPAASKPKPTEEPQMAQLEIDGKSYWHDPETQGLWEVTGETFADGSAWTGYYQPGDEEEPIRYTEAFGDE
jgi:hypothetical protein